MRLALLILALPLTMSFHLIKGVFWTGKKAISIVGHGVIKTWRFVGNGKKGVKLIKTADGITGFSSKVLDLPVPLYTLI